MSHGKETPRQKMISLMYLVLTCLLALNVSREVLLGFVSINESLEKSSNDFDVAATKAMEAAERAIADGHREVIPYVQKAKIVTGIVARTRIYIDSLKKEVITYTEKKSGADTLHLSETEQLENNDRPAHLLIGSEEAHPKKGKYTALELREKLSFMCDSLTALVDGMHAKDGTRLPEHDFNLMRQRLQALRPITAYKGEDNKLISWELKQFHNLPMAAVVTQLTRIQSEIKQIHTEIIGLFAAAAGKLSIPFDRMEAKLVAKQLYVQQGESFEAKVFLGASSTKFTTDNLQFVLGDVDTATGKLAPNAIVLPVENGSAGIRLPGSALGHQAIKGWIRLRDGTGTYKYFKYESEYIVAPSAVAISADKMNVLYAGVDNPLSVSAAGVAPGDLEVRIEGGNAKLIPGANGTYSVKVSAGSNATVTVFQRTPDGLKKQGAAKVFRVKRLPNPPVKILGKTVDASAEMTQVEARSITQLGLDLSNFDFAAPFKVLSFSVTMGGGGNGFQFFKCEGSSFTPQAIDALRRIKKGSKIYIEDIIVDAPDAKRELPLVKIAVK